MSKRKATDDASVKEDALIEGEITINNTPVPRNFTNTKTIYDPEGYIPVGSWVEVCAAPQRLPTDSKGQTIPYSDIKRKKVKLASKDEKNDDTWTKKTIENKNKDKKHSI